MAAQGRLGPGSWLFLFLGSKPSFLSEPLLVPLPPPGSRGPAEHTSRRPLPPSQDTSGPDELRPWQVAQSETDAEGTSRLTVSLSHCPCASKARKRTTHRARGKVRVRGRLSRAAFPGAGSAVGSCDQTQSSAQVCPPASETVPSPQMTSGARAAPPPGARGPRWRPGRKDAERQTTTRPARRPASVSRDRARRLILTHAQTKALSGKFYLTSEKDSGDVQMHMSSNSPPHTRGHVIHLEPVSGHGLLHHGSSCSSRPASGKPAVDTGITARGSAAWQGSPCSGNPSRAGDTRPGVHRSRRPLLPSGEGRVKYGVDPDASLPRDGGK